MHSLSLLPKDEVEGPKTWTLVENFLQRILNMGPANKLEFNEVKDLIQNRIEAQEAKKKVGKLEEERQSLQSKLDNVTSESSKKLKQILEEHQHQLLEIAAKNKQKMEAQESEHKHKLIQTENKNKVTFSFFKKILVSQKLKK